MGTASKDKDSENIFVFDDEDLTTDGLDEKDFSTYELAPVEPKENIPATLDTTDLNDEAVRLLDKLIHETDIEKTKDLTYLFNLNQNKKTAVRINKMSTLLDALAEQTLQRLTARPNEISNQELLTGLKVVQDLIERGQKQLQAEPESAPLIQFNQQNNELNINNDSPLANVSRESREKVKNAVTAVLSMLQNSNTTIDVTDNSSEIVDENIINLKNNLGGKDE